MSQSGDAFKNAIFMTGGGVALFFYGVFSLIRARLIENTPTSKARSVALGYAEFSGTASGPAPIVAPVSKQKAVWWECTVSKKQGKNSWRELFHATSPQPLFLKDETGRVLIDPVGANFDCPSKNIFRSSFAATRFNEALSNIGAAHLASGFSFFSGAIRITEKCIPLDSPLYVLGEVRRADQYNGIPKRADLQQTFRDHLVAAKRDPKEMARADENRDGQISPEEWDKFVELKRKAFEASKNTVPEKELSDLLVVTASDENGQPFMICVGDESQVLRKMRGIAVFAFIGGLIASYFGARTLMTLRPAHAPYIIAAAAAAGLALACTINKFTRRKKNAVN